MSTNLNMQRSRKPFAADLASLAFIFLLLSVAAGPAVGQSATGPWGYILLEGSFLVDDCPICARHPIEVPMRGTFRLRPLEQNPLISRFAVEDISFVAGPYTARGSGTYQFGGAVALLQQMFLQVTIDNGFTSKLCYFTNVSSRVDRPWPMLDILLNQTNGTFNQVF